MPIIIFLCILCLIFLLLIIPVCVSIEFCGDLKIYVHYLFLKIKVNKEQTKEQKELKAEKKKAKAAVKEAKLAKAAAKPNAKPIPEKLTVMDKIKKDGFETVIKHYLAILKILFRRLNKLLKHLRILKMQTAISLCNGDVNKLSQNYGIITLAVYNAYATIDEYIHIENPLIDIRSDFIGDESVYYFYMKIRIRPIFIIQFALNALIDYIKISINGKTKKNNKQKLGVE